MYTYRRLNAKELMLLWLLEKTLQSPPWTARRSIHYILKEINPEYSLEGVLLKLKLQYFVHLMWRNDSFKKTLMLGKIEGGRRRGQQRMRWLMASPTQCTWVWVNSGCWWWTGRPGVLQSMGSQSVRHEWETELKKNFDCWDHISVLAAKTPCFQRRYSGFNT